MHIPVWMFEPFCFVFGAIIFCAASYIYGIQKTWLFLLGVAVVAGFNEHVNIFMGNYNYYWHSSPRDFAYFANYTKSLGGNWAWIGVLPGFFFPGWFMVCMMCYTITRNLFPNGSPFLIAVGTSLQITMMGFVGENLGLINHWWEYTSRGKFLTFWDGIWGGVFVYYIFWVTSLIFVFEKTIIKNEEISFIKKFERALFKESNELTIYCFRLVIFSIISSSLVRIFDVIVLQPFAR